MKKLICLCLACVLSLAASFSLAADELSPEDVGFFVNQYYENHQLRHATDTLYPSGDVVPPNEFTFTKASPKSLMGCSEYKVYETRELPADPLSINAVFSEMFVLGFSVSKHHPAVESVDVQTLEEKYKLDVSFVVPSYGWWHTGITENYVVYTGPVMLGDANDNIIDDTVYALSVFCSEGETRIWLCADQDIVYRMITALNPPLTTDDSATGMYLVDWLFRNQSRYGSGDSGTNTWLVDESGFIPVQGTVTVTHARKVKVRAADHTSAPVLLEAQPGDTFPTSAITDNSWYKITLESGEDGYISPNVVDFTAE